jgi:hypothetical protein
MKLPKLIRPSYHNILKNNIKKYMGTSGNPSWVFRGFDAFPPEVLGNPRPKG